MRQVLIVHRFKTWALLGLAVAATHCSRAGSLAPPEPEEESAEGGDEQGGDDSGQGSKSDDAGQYGRLLRRMVLDVAGRLPSVEERARVEEKGTAEFSEILRDLMDDREAWAGHLAALHRFVWHLNPFNLPDLDRIAALDGEALTRDQRLEYLDAVLGPVESTLSSGEALDTILSGLASEENAQSLGLSFLAAFGSEDQASSPARMSRLLGVLRCQSWESVSAHSWEGEEAEALAGDLRSTALTRTECAACHAQYQPAAPAIAGLAWGTDLADWEDLARYDGGPGLLAGSEFDDAPSWLDLLRDDPARKQCHSRRLLQAIAQREMTLEDWSGIVFLDNAWRRNHGNLLTALRSSLYPDGVLAHALDWRLTPRTSRYLHRSLWQSLAAQLLPDDATLPVFELTLDPGSDNALDSELQIPNGSYFESVDVLVRTLAKAIVEHDLHAGREVVDRKVLSQLGDAEDFAHATAEEVSAQIEEVWEALTGLASHSSQGSLDALGEIHSAISRDSTDPAVHRLAWQAVLVSIMLGHEFVTY